MLKYLAPLFAACACFAQTPGKPAPALNPTSAAKLAETGHCPEALPQLRKALTSTQDPNLKRRVATAGVRCGMTLNQAADAIYFLEWMKREFPRDPAVLYLASHVYSDLSLRESNELLVTAPGSPEVHQLNAEALETQGKWDDAAKEYRAVLEKDPNI